MGHALSAIRNFESANRLGGRFLLRIEDIDLGRRRPEYETAIYEDLAWLGLDWEKPVRRQSDHFDDYRAAADKLRAGGLLYRCCCTRADIARTVADRPDWPRDPDGALLYPGTCRHRDLSNAQDVAWRLDMRRAVELCLNPSWREFGEGDEPQSIAADPLAWGDIVLVRKDVPTSYHLSVTVDDALQDVTDVMRGRDLYHATSVHRVLQTLLDLREPNYRHHHLLLDVDGRKLSKSDGAKSLRAMREAGVSAAEVYKTIFTGSP